MNQLFNLFACLVLFTPNLTQAAYPLFYPDLPPVIDRQHYVNSVHQSFLEEGQYALTVQQNSIRLGPQYLKFLSDEELALKDIADQKDPPAFAELNFVESLANRLSPQTRQIYDFIFDHHRLPDLSQDLIDSYLLVRSYAFLAASRGEITDVESLSVIMLAGLGGPQRTELSRVLKHSGSQVLLDPAKRALAAMQIISEATGPKSTHCSDVMEWLSPKDPE